LATNGAAGEAEEGPSARGDAMPLDRKIRVKDRVRIKEHRLLDYRSVASGVDCGTVFTVVAIDKVGHSKRLILNDSPSVIWYRDAKLAWKPNCKERWEALGV
jgi:hypothetical protein